MDAPLFAARVKKLDRVIRIADHQIRILCTACWTDFSQNTRSSYATAYRYWCAWYFLRSGKLLRMPVPEQEAERFIQDHAAVSFCFPEPQPDLNLQSEMRQLERVQHAPSHSDRLRHVAPMSATCNLPEPIDVELQRRKLKSRLGALAFATLKHRVYVLSSIHESLGFHSPMDSAAGLRMLGNAKDHYAALGRSRRPAKPILLNPLRAILDTCEDSMVGRRDRAMLLFIWSGGLKSSEAVAANYERLQKVGPQQYLYHLERMRQAKPRASVSVRVEGSAAKALENWLTCSAIVSGPIFRQILKTGRVMDAPMSRAFICAMVKKRCEKAGLPSTYTAHSLRAGFLTEAQKHGVEFDVLANLTGACMQTLDFYRRRPHDTDHVFSLDVGSWMLDS